MDTSNASAVHSDALNYRINWDRSSDCQAEEVDVKKD
jgi:hypothetical protein